ncbi:hypothetical protein LINPERPRIM_LOCUS33253 [Linum perenne]
MSVPTAGWGAIRFRADNPGFLILSFIIKVYVN